MSYFFLSIVYKGSVQISLVPELYTYLFRTSNVRCGTTRDPKGPCRGRPARFSRCSHSRRISPAAALKPILRCRTLTNPDCVSTNHGSRGLPAPPARSPARGPAVPGSGRPSSGRARLAGRASRQRWRCAAVLLDARTPWRTANSGGKWDSFQHVGAWEDVVAGERAPPLTLLCRCEGGCLQKDNKVIFKKIIKLSFFLVRAWV